MRHHSSALALLCLLSTAAPVAAQRLALPLAQGGHCGFVVPCARSGGLAAHLRWTLMMLDVTSSERLRPHGQFGLSASLWEWAEVGASWQLGMARGAHTGFIQGPVTLWGRFSPPPLSALASPRWDEGFFLAAQGEYQVGRAPFDQGGQLARDNSLVSLVAEWRKWRFLLSAVGSGEFSDSYRGVRAGGALGITVSRKIGLQVRGEALGRVGFADDGFRTGWLFTVGITALDEWGIEGGLAYLHGDGEGLPGPSAIAQGGLTVGPRYRKPAGHVPLREVPPWLMSWYARVGMIIDPVLDASGWIVDDDGTPLYHAADPDPDQPGLLKLKRSGQSFAPGTHFYRSGRMLLAIDGQPVEEMPALLRLSPQQALDHALDASKKARECVYCQPDPLPPGDGASGYALGCAALRYAKCGIPPWEDTQGPQLGALGTWRRPPVPPVVSIYTPAAAKGPKFPPATKRTAWNINKKWWDDGKPRCENCGDVVVPPKKPTPGQPPPSNQGEVDHIYPRSKGGPATLSNARILCRNCNLKKSDKVSP